MNIFWKRQLRFGEPAGPGQGVDVEEDAHREGALVPAQPVRRHARVVPASRRALFCIVLFCVVATAHSPAQLTAIGLHPPTSWNAQMGPIDASGAPITAVRHAIHGDRRSSPV